MASILFLISSSSSSLAFSPNREEMLLRTLSMSGKMLEESSRHSSIISKSDFLSTACCSNDSSCRFISSCVGSLTSRYGWVSRCFAASSYFAIAPGDSALTTRYDERKDLVKIIYSAFLRARLFEISPMA